FIVGLYVLSSLIWTVDVVGTRDLEPEFVLEKAKEVGLYPGAWRPAGSEIDRLQGKLLQLLPNVGWVGLHMAGTRITIEVMEQVKPKERDGSPAGPQQVVAAKRGVVESVLARRGVIRVHRGQTVAPGALLISGQMPDGTLVAAEGAVNAHVWYTSEITVPLRGKQLGLTGEKQSRQYLTFGTLAIPIWGKAHIPFASYEVREINVPLTVGGRTWPVGWRQVEFWEATGREWEIARDDAVRRGLEAVKADLLSRAKPGSRVEEQKVLHQEWKNGNLYMTVWTDVLEDIGVAQPITSPGPAVPGPGVSEPGSESGG
ncbi:MAG: sporulation protein YqfD, partial [Alicyclobacillaceae bacterium]|nr:sporulation protein YqfD [Alicyclobacillaceae bacterium]